MLQKKALATTGGLTRVLAIRALAGANVFFSGVGAIVEIITCDEDKLELAKAYEDELRKVLDSLSWHQVIIHKQVYSQGLIFAIATEYDLIYAGCKILWITFDLVEAKFNGQPALNYADEIEYLASVISKERYPTLRKIYHEAQKRALNVYLLDGTLSIGSGKGAYIAQIDNINCNDVPWDAIYEIPSVMVTGTNGKTTTVRLVSFISKHAGKVVGYCSTDWVMVDGEIISEGDLSGPSGNRTVMTNPQVEVAVLEVARGGMVKRGLATSNVNGAVVVNVSEDHLGVNGIDTVYDLAKVKFTVHNAIRPGGHSVINLDDPLSLEFIATLNTPKAFVSQKLSQSEILAYLNDPEDYAAFIEDNGFYLYRAGQKYFIAAINDVDLTYNGLAKHNIENVLIAICLSLELGRTYAEISAGLLAFINDENNRGRFNFFEVKKSRILVDYGHNLVSVDNMLKFARSIASVKSKITVLLGFSGDRKFMIDNIAKCVMKHEIDYVIIKLFESHLRGAEKGELAQLMHDRLLKRGFNEKNIIATVDTEMEALALVLAKLEDEHIYILLCQDDTADVIEVIKRFIKAA